MKIETRLRLLASQNANYAPLLAQWEFDKRLLSRALNTVSNNFPHYSLHDESHSSTIINQIEKVISPNIELLSATDCWLLLEACYWHDSGMIINHDEKKNLVNDASFIQHLKDLSIGNGEFSQHAGSILKGINAGDVDKLLNDSQYLVFIIADYYRSKHALRSEEHINNPEKIGINSPRTHLIPERLISLLAAICSCHGKSPESILELPQSSDGMDSEDYAHSRYIAALLRIGDLLDIDDGRFCETLLRNISNLPQYSLAHKRKHESVQQLYIDSRVIEIKAKCQDYESFAVQQAWFDYIQAEFDYQKRVWNDIVPKQNYVALPTVNNITCEIVGYITMNGKVPKVTLNKERIYQYLTGKLLYGNSSPFIRELIQNSIDAIHYKVWSKYFYDDESDFYIKTNSVEVDRELFIEKLSLEKISVGLNIDAMSSNGYILSIKDSGIGMGIVDIEKVMNVGAGNKGEKYNIILSMPDWAKPSGFFGIGFQSVFDASDKVVIETRKDGEAGYQIEFNRNRDNIPTVGIKKINKKWFEGTVIDIYLNEDNAEKISSSVRLSNLHYYSGRMEGFHLDPLIRMGLSEEKRLSNMHEEMSYNIGKVFRNLVIPLHVNSKKVSGSDLNNRSSSWSSDYELGVDYHLTVSNDKAKKLSISYRGAVVDSDFHSDMLKGNIDIFIGSADEWVSINRDGFQSERVQEVSELIEACVEKNKIKIYEASEDKNMASLYLKAMYGFESDLWRNILVNGVLLGDVFDNGIEVRCNGVEKYSRENIFELKGSEPNPINVLALFSRFVLKEGRVPICECIHSDGSLYEEYHLKMTVVKEPLKGQQYVSPDIIKRDVDRFPIIKSTRLCAMCYSDYFNEISLFPSEFPEGTHFSSAGPTFDNSAGAWIKYVFLPYSREKVDFNKEFEVVYGYLDNLGKGIEKVRAEQLFKEYWESLGVMPEE
ncbi:High temperature protein G [Serratia fonticola]|uniref:HD domain-containing protein n=1 Tax=Serratia fonticola TaxID=47917 RepID=UPI00217A074F|nr:ATP-binding protein [Serratia fonticola]CAI0696582.1 High temperature protein G [Serratia fonticola]